MPMQTGVFINLDMYVVPTNIFAILLALSLSPKLYIPVIQYIARCLRQLCDFNILGGLNLIIF